MKAIWSSTKVGRPLLLSLMDCRSYTNFAELYFMLFIYLLGTGWHLENRVNKMRLVVVDKKHWSKLAALSLAKELKIYTLEWLKMKAISSLNGPPIVLTGYLATPGKHGVQNETIGIPCPLWWVTVLVLSPWGLKKLRLNYSRLYGWWCYGWPVHTQVIPLAFNLSWRLVIVCLSSAIPKSTEADYQLFP